MNRISIALLIIFTFNLLATVIGMIQGVSPAVAHIFYLLRNIAMLVSFVYILLCKQIIKIESEKRSLLWGIIAVAVLLAMQFANVNRGTQYNIGFACLIFSATCIGVLLFRNKFNRWEQWLGTATFGLQAIMNIIAMFIFNNADHELAARNLTSINATILICNAVTVFYLGKRARRIIFGITMKEYWKEELERLNRELQNRKKSN